MSRRFGIAVEPAGCELVEALRPGAGLAWGECPDVLREGAFSLQLPGSEALDAQARAPGRARDRPILVAEHEAGVAVQLPAVGALLAAVLGCLAYLEVLTLVESWPPLEAYAGPGPKPKYGIAVVCAEAALQEDGASPKLRHYGAFKLRDKQVEVAMPRGAAADRNRTPADPSTADGATAGTGGAGGVGAGGERTGGRGGRGGRRPRGRGLQASAAVAP